MSVLGLCLLINGSGMFACISLSALSRTYLFDTRALYLLKFIKETTGWLLHE